MDMEDEQILKQDALGRVRVPKERREEMVDAFEASGMSGKAFAEQHGINYQTFASWIQKRRRARGDYKNEEMRRQLRASSREFSAQKNSSRDAPLNLVEVNVDSSLSGASLPALEIVLPGGAIVKISLEDQLGLLKALLHEFSC